MKNHGTDTIIVSESDQRIRAFRAHKNPGQRGSKARARRLEHSPFSFGMYKPRSFAGSSHAEQNRLFLRGKREWEDGCG